MQKLSDYLTADGWQCDVQEFRHRYDTICSPLERMANATYNVYMRNDIIKTNANIIAAAFPSIAAASATSALMEKAGFDHATVSVSAAVADWIAYIPVHVYLQYRSKKNEFIHDGSFTRREFWKHIAHLYATNLPSITLFYALAGPTQYALMEGEVGKMHLPWGKLGGGVANQLSYWSTMVVTRTLHTIIGQYTGLFKKRSVV